jgi:hypothetical protein
MITIKELECAYFHGLLVHGQATSARTPLNSTVEHYKLAIKVSFITLRHLELSKSLALYYSSIYCPEIQIEGPLFIQHL